MSIYNERHTQYITTLDDGYLISIPAPDGTHRTRTLRGGHTDENLSRAQRLRDRMYRVLHGTSVPRRIFQARLREDGKASPLRHIVLPPGITYVEKKVKSRHGNDVSYVVPCIMALVHLERGANYEKPKRPRSKLFSLNKYEIHDAIERAVAWRATMCNSLGFEQ